MILSAQQKIKTKIKTKIGAHTTFITSQTTHVVLLDSVVVCKHPKDKHRLINLGGKKQKTKNTTKIITH